MDSNEELDYYIKVVTEEGNDDIMEFPKEIDDTILLSTLQAQFPNAIGLKYKGSSGAWRALSAKDNVFSPPREGWGDTTYVLTVADVCKTQKTEIDDNHYEMQKSRRNIYLEDCGVMNLPFDVTEEEMREYFEEKYGELDFCELKIERDTGKSRGYGFVRFKEQSQTKQAIEDEHMFKGRKVYVRLKQEKNIKLFVGRLSQGTTAEDLREYFSRFGEIKDTYVPQPFRNFGFVTFVYSEDGKRAMKDPHHNLKGSRLNVEERNPETNRSRDKERSRDGRDRSRDRSRERSRDRSRNRKRERPYRSNDRRDGSGYSSESSHNHAGNSEDSNLKKMLLQVLQNS